MMSIKILIINLFLITALLAESSEVGQPTKVDDDLKVSGKVGDLIDGLETVEKANNAVKAARNAPENIKRAQEFAKTPKLSDIKNGLSNMLLKYKHTKSGMLSILSDVTQKISKGLNAAERRVNMWRSTEPTLYYYGEQMKKMANNTVDVFLDFEPEAMWDIDRKWDRRMNAQLAADKNLALSFKYFTEYRSSELERNRKVFKSFLDDYTATERLTRTEEGLKALLTLKSEKPIHEFRLIPQNTLMYTSDVITSVNEINKISYEQSSDDNTLTKEQFTLSKIQKVLNDPNQTYEDTKNLSVLIADQRLKVKTQKANISQLLSLLEARYARLLLRKTEQKNLQHAQYKSTLSQIVKSGKLETADEHRKRIFGESEL